MPLFGKPGGRWFEIGRKKFYQRISGGGDLIYSFLLVNFSYLARKIIILSVIYF